jgi:hypothetical protein
MMAFMALGTSGVIATKLGDRNQYQTEFIYIASAEIHWAI